MNDFACLILIQKLNEWYSDYLYFIWINQARKSTYKWIFNITYIFFKRITNLNLLEFFFFLKIRCWWILINKKYIFKYKIKNNLEIQKFKTRNNLLIYIAICFTFMIFFNFFNFKLFLIYYLTFNINKLSKLEKGKRKTNFIKQKEQQKKLAKLFPSWPN